MKRLMISIAIIGVFLVGVGAVNAPAKAKKERALVQFTETVRLRDAFLRGQYLVVHDEDRMAQGEACLYIYRGEVENADRLVVAYHCRPVERTKVDQFTILTSRANSFDMPEVLEIQFGGSSEAHQVRF